MITFGLTLTGIGVSILIAGTQAETTRVRVLVIVLGVAAALAGAVLAVVGVKARRRDRAGVPVAMRLTNSQDIAVTDSKFPGVGGIEVDNVRRMSIDRTEFGDPRQESPGAPERDSEGAKGA